MIDQQGAALRQIIDRIRSSLELRVVLQTAVDELAALLNLDRCTFFWYFQDTQRIQLVCERSSPESPANPLSPSDLPAQPGTPQPMLRLGYYPIHLFGPFTQAITQGKLLVQPSPISLPPPLAWLSRWLPASPRLTPSEASPILGTQANLMVPCPMQDGTLGFIGCLSNQPRQWTVTEVELLQTISQQLAIAIEQAQLYEQTQKQAQREQLVNQITAQTRQSFELPTILKGAIAQLLEVLQVDRCLVHLVDEIPHDESSAKAGVGKTQASRYAVSREKHLYEVCRPPFAVSTDEFDLNGPITQWVMANQRRVVISNVAIDPRIGPENPEYQRAEIKSSLVVPVQTKETLHAILYLNQCSHVRFWSKNDQKLAQAVADQLAISIQQARLYAKTQQQAIESAAQARHLAATLQELRLTQAQLIQSEKMSSLGRVVAGIAHEINNPINFVLGNLTHVNTYMEDLVTLIKAYQAHYPNPALELQDLQDRLELDFLLTDLPPTLKSMRSGAERVRSIILSLRNFSRLDEADYKAVHIHEGIESTLMILQSYINEEISIHRQYSSLPKVKCYPRQLNQALMNILLNSVEALTDWSIEHKQITIATSLVHRASDKADFAESHAEIESILRIVIKDNGPGIAPDLQSKIFDPFFTTKDVGQGTGLGLTVSYQVIVDQHQGQLKLISQAGQGAEFVIEIPVMVESETDGSAHRSPHIPSTKPDAHEDLPLEGDRVMTQEACTLHSS
ncbi:GAF domain-containing protein [Alkalinema sp. FACHB-956]|uniref:GAF domain-containing sensor histidine kinase n=1 Tax=Alkalinema sp. FACHB-956 TaxID=2692768 RepID=UPI00168587FE|nr:GAF domain-containing protein [Alkalinema sp. FACHB-956]MBD2327310.1 GAF domain-containing sensor histidine kinase [Alkalinema sp. FACHB-956]